MYFREKFMNDKNKKRKKKIVGKTDIMCFIRQTYVQILHPLLLKRFNNTELKTKVIESCDRYTGTHVCMCMKDEKRVIPSL